MLQCLLRFLALGIQSVGGSTTAPFLLPLLLLSLRRYIFFLSHGDYKSPQIIARVMDYFKFM